MLFDLLYVTLNQEFILKAEWKDGTFFFHFSSNNTFFVVVWNACWEFVYWFCSSNFFPCFLNTGFPACSASCLLGQSNYYLSSLWKQCLHAFSKCQRLPVSRRKMCWWQHNAEECKCTFLPWLDTEWDLSSWTCWDCKTQTITWVWTCTGSVGREEQQSRSIFLCGGEGPGSNIYFVELLSVFLVLLPTECPIWEHSQTKILYD